MLFKAILLGDLVSQEESIGPNIYFAGEPAPFTPEIAASKQMQSEHMTADDAPVDVNCNAVHARFHAGTMDITGRSMANNSDRREKMMDAGVGIFKQT